MIKKIICLGVILTMCLGFFSGCANDYTYKEGDFSLVVTVDKTEVSVGDTIEVAATLKNLSSTNIRIQMRHTDFKKLEDMISIGMFEENTEHDFIINSKGGPRRKMRIKKDVIIKKSMEFDIEKSINYDLSSLVIFYTGKDYSEAVTIYSKSIRINIKE